MCAMGGVRTVDFHPAFATHPVMSFGRVVADRLRRTQRHVGHSIPRQAPTARAPRGVGSLPARRHVSRTTEAMGLERPPTHGRHGRHPIRFGGRPRLLETGGASCQAIGQRLTEHHRWLSEGIDVSTERIDALLEQAAQLGACGGKSTVPAAVERHSLFFLKANGNQRWMHSTQQTQGSSRSTWARKAFE